MTFIFFDPKKLRNFFKKFWGHGLAPTGNLSNVTCRPRDTRDMNKRSKRGQKSKFSKTRYIFLRFARTEATAKILGRWEILENSFFMKLDFDNESSERVNMVAIIGFFKQLYHPNMATHA